MKLCCFNRSRSIHLEFLLIVGFEEECQKELISGLSHLLPRMSRRPADCRLSIWKCLWCFMMMVIWKYLWCFMMMVITSSFVGVEHKLAENELLKQFLKSLAISFVAMTSCTLISDLMLDASKSKDCVLAGADEYMLQSSQDNYYRILEETVPEQRLFREASPTKLLSELKVLQR